MPRDEGSAATALMFIMGVACILFIVSRFAAGEGPPSPADWLIPGLLAAGVVTVGVLQWRFIEWRQSLRARTLQPLDLGAAFQSPEDRAVERWATANPRLVAVLEWLWAPILGVLVLVITPWTLADAVLAAILLALAALTVVAVLAFRRPERAESPPSPLSDDDLQLRLVNRRILEPFTPSGEREPAEPRTFSNTDLLTTLVIASGAGALSVRLLVGAPRDWSDWGLVLAGLLLGPLGAASSQHPAMARLPGPAVGSAMILYLAIMLSLIWGRSDTTAGGLFAWFVLTTAAGHAALGISSSFSREASDRVQTVFTFAAIGAAIVAVRMLSRVTEDGVPDWPLWLAVQFALIAAIAAVVLTPVGRLDRRWPLAMRGLRQTLVWGFAFSLVVLGPVDLAGLLFPFVGVLVLLPLVAVCSLFLTARNKRFAQEAREQRRPLVLP